MTQLLNRLISVTGESSITMPVDVRFHYTIQEALNPLILQTGEWGAFQADPQQVADRNTEDAMFSDVLTNANQLVGILRGNGGLVVASAYYLDGNNNNPALPFPDNLDDNVPLTIRIHGPSDGQYVEGVVAAITTSQLSTPAFNDPVGQPRQVLWLDDATVLSGASFDVDGALTFSFVGRTLPEPVTRSTKEVWARLAERGANIGLVVSVDGESGSDEGAQETIEATIRYDPGLAIGVEFTDDLGRRWVVLSSRTVGDRRYLAFEAVRYIVGLTLPEFAGSA